MKTPFDFRQVGTRIEVFVKGGLLLLLSGRGRRWRWRRQKWWSILSRRTSRCSRGTMRRPRRFRSLILAGRCQITSWSWWTRSRVMPESWRCIGNNGPILKMLLPMFQEKSCESRPIFAVIDPSPSFARIQGAYGLLNVVSIVRMCIVIRTTSTKPRASHDQSGSLAIYKFSNSFGNCSIPVAGTRQSTLFALLFSGWKYAVDDRCV